ncbi:aminotransferase class V-fold PLP-dependent enzyme [Virgibacillus pantothenticus]|uniref:Septum site-determining protein n=1 Tax=Virgibacillus pantothenticus TaxID=1473 RepID=A0A0L0QMZ9_VIRPA|nr:MULTISPECIES: GNAT family N-acetyltransferase [Virgibacillus]API93603.1 septum site-determining protein [Virgibacillus sp. 6R]KNE19894.1 septum site-determining protein [Virgibacillus pantothenticus]MBS7430005.1 aminotransferase class V-fold PLP-dependent enzyme [Virgibacillus sp. 19R1-5]MBU8564897.1 aminotransferase class V-fold PLP-dependent enzyme [Virgibacillus pantothenticus]MBU8599205.1 aminotransferase class V-fold PLP-dependent enzyme [Virgibacillus pantothenticus]
MKESLSVVYKIADLAEELEQIYRLNYETFVEEIPQHETNHEHRLVDRFNDKNTYVVAKRNDEVIGMISVNDQRPFSLDQKLNNLDDFLPEHAIPCEIRLLAIKKQYRGGRIFYGLCERLVDYCLEKGFNMAVISGTLRQTKLYKHLGFQAFGPLVGTEEAPYQPMYLTKKNFERASKLFERMLRKEEQRNHYNFLPGPVEVSNEVKKAWGDKAVSHRAKDVHDVIENVQQQLCRLTKANYVEIAVGTGTLANDMIAAQLTTISSKGLVLANGEFGERLIKHASRFNLSFYTITKPWSKPISLAEIEQTLDKHREIGWLWTVHCETSTGYVYPLEKLKQLCNKYGVRLCMDTCSTVGVMSVDLASVYLASTVSGKGLGSYPGLAIVFHQEKLLPNEAIPSYLDLGKYQINGSIPYTHSSNGLFALQAALQQLQPERTELFREICQEFQKAGMEVLTGENYSPGIVTICLNPMIDSRKFGDALKQKGVHVSYESGYLLNHNWFQVAIMGQHQASNILKGIKIIVEVYQQFSKAKEFSRCES